MSYDPRRGFPAVHDLRSAFLSSSFAPSVWLSIIFLSRHLLSVAAFSSSFFLFFFFGGGGPASAFSAVASAFCLHIFFFFYLCVCIYFRADYVLFSSSSLLLLRLSVCHCIFFLSLGLLSVSATAASSPLAGLCFFRFLHTYISFWPLHLFLSVSFCVSVFSLLASFSNLDLRAGVISSGGGACVQVLTGMAGLCAAKVLVVEVIIYNAWVIIPQQVMAGMGCIGENIHSANLRLLSA